MCGGLVGVGGGGGGGGGGGVAMGSFSSSFLSSMLYILFSCSLSLFLRCVYNLCCVG